MYAYVKLLYYNTDPLLSGESSMPKMHDLNEESLDSKWKCIVLKSGHMPLK